MKITSNKLISIIKKNNLPIMSGNNYHSSGFNVRKEYLGDRITVTYSGKNGIKEVENFVFLGNYLLEIGVVPGFSISDYGSVTFHFNSQTPLIYSEEFFRVLAQPHIEKYNENIAEQNRIQEEKNNHRKNIHDQKWDIAVELNPNIEYTIVQQFDENNFVGWVSLNTQTEFPVSMQFSAERKSSWFNNNMLWNLSLQPMYYDRNHYSGGSTSCNDCEEVEFGLLEYLVSWHIRLPETESE